VIRNNKQRYVAHTPHVDGISYHGYDVRMAKTVAAAKKRKSPKRSSRLSGASRRTITLPRTIEAEVLARAGDQQFSAYTTRALEHSLQRDRIYDWFKELEAQQGRVTDPAAIVFAEQSWRNRKR
jgi:hypothetical protein